MSTHTCALGKPRAGQQLEPQVIDTGWFLSLDNREHALTHADTHRHDPDVARSKGCNPFLCKRVMKTIFLESPIKSHVANLRKRTHADPRTPSRSGCCISPGAHQKSPNSASTVGVPRVLCPGITPRATPIWPVHPNRTAQTSVGAARGGCQRRGSATRRSPPGSRGSDGSHTRCLDKLAVTGIP